MGDLNRNILYLIWKDPRSRSNYIIGKLAREKTYTFEYCGEYEKALELGWKLLDAFPYIKKYESDTLFAAFSARLPDPKRRGIEEILKKYDLTEYDGYELLKRSTGKLPIDTYEFIDPILQEDKTVVREFYIVGIRHQAKCKGDNCDRLPNVKVHDELILCREPENEYDEYAVKILSCDGEVLGYVPRYYSEGVFDRLTKGSSYSCEVVEVSDVKNCECCVKVVLRIPKDATRY